MSLPSSYKRIILRERPNAGPITPTTFELQTLPTASLRQNLKDNQVLVHVEYVSLDPAMRGWIREQRSYIEPVKVGAVMRAGGIGKVVEVGKDVVKVKVGDSVNVMSGWTEYGVYFESQVETIKAPPGAIDLDFMGILGGTGLTAYFGLFEVGKLRAGETLVVSGAAGATGSVVCQLGKLAGARVIALAGADDKCRWLENELGVDKALNYKSKTFVQDFKKAVGYLDVYFDNVGGEILDLCLTRMKKYARVVLCGAISAYNETKPRGLQAYLNCISQSATMQGFVIFDYQSRWPAAREDLAKWIEQGKLKRRFHFETGLQNAPRALDMLFAGKNTGKMVVQVSSGPTPKL